MDEIQRELRSFSCRTVVDVYETAIEVGHTGVALVAGQEYVQRCYDVGRKLSSLLRNYRMSLEVDLGVINRTQRTISLFIAKHNRLCAEGRLLAVAHDGVDFTSFDDEVENE